LQPNSQYCPVKAIKRLSKMCDLSNPNVPVFVTFERYVTNLRGTFVPVPISTHPIPQSPERGQES
jgi:hypothetical protein